MFSINQKRKISKAVQKILRETSHPELPESEIEFSLHVKGKEDWSWADIKNNGSVTKPGVNLWNELQETECCGEKEDCCQNQKKVANKSKNKNKR